MSIIPQTLGQWWDRPGFVQYVKHAYWLGGYDIKPNVGLDIDGLEWVRTFNLRERRTGVEYRMIEPEDVPIITGHRPSEEDIIRMYGRPVGYETPPEHLTKRRYYRVDWNNG